VPLTTPSVARAKQDRLILHQPDVQSIQGFKTIDPVRAPTQESCTGQVRAVVPLLRLEIQFPGNYYSLRTHMKTWIMTSNPAPMTKNSISISCMRQKMERYINSLTTHAREVKECIWILAMLCPHQLRTRSS
jgi:hypothetical protein